MIYLELFLTFFNIGAVSFGGGYGMIAIVYDQMIRHGWMNSSEVTDMIAVSESTPGPLAVNMATFVGTKQAGIAGGMLATLGVVLPAFIIILLISVVLRNLIKYKGVQAFLGGIRPCVVGMITATTIIMGLERFAGVEAMSDKISIDAMALVIMTVLVLIHVVYKKIRNKKPDPIVMIVLSAFLGVVLKLF